MDKTIKEVAEMLTVSKSAIRKYMTDDFRKKYTHQSGNRILISEAGLSELKQRIKHQSTQTSTQTNVHQDANRTQTVDDAALYKDLESQLRVKDEQIANLHKLLDQAQQLHLIAESKIKRLEGSEPEEPTEEKAASTPEQSQSEDSSEPNQEPVKRQSWLRRLFK